MWERPGQISAASSRGALELHFPEFPDPSDGVLVIVELGVQEGLEDFLGCGPADQPGAHGDDVRVVVLHALMGGVDVVSQGATDARDLVGRHHGANPGAADQHGPLGLAGADEIAGGPGDVREIDGGLAGRAAVDDLMAEIFQD